MEYCAQDPHLIIWQILTDILTVHLRIKIHFLDFLSQCIGIIVHIAGYHKVTKNDAIKIGALLYRTKFGDSKAEFQLFP